MANALALKANMPVRAFVLGRPKSGKTGSLACLADAGFKLRVLDYDWNPEPLLQYASEAALANVDVVQLKDELWDSPDGLTPRGMPTAFTDGLRMMQKWAYKLPDGTEVDLGSSKDWGPDHVVVIDSATSFGTAAKNRAMIKLNKTRKNSNWRVWDFAQQDMVQAIRIMKTGRYHLIVFSHPKMIGPEMVNEDDDDTTKDIKKAVAELVPTRLYPSAPGKALSQVIGAELPIIIKADVRTHQGVEKRMFTAAPSLDTDTGAPLLNMKWPQPAETALLEVFKAMGVRMP